MMTLPVVGFGADEKPAKTPDGSDFFQSRTYGGVEAGGTRLKTKARVRTYPSGAGASTVSYSKKDGAGSLGLHLGRHEMVGRWMHGLELNAHFHGNKLKTQYRGVNNILLQDKVDRYGGIGMALTGGGLLADRLLAYGKLGIDMAHFRLTRVENAGTSNFGIRRRDTFRPGLVLGAGVNFALTERVTARVESNYRTYRRWNSKSMATTQQPGSTYIRNRFQAVTTMVGLSYRYGTTKKIKNKQE